jgi:dUTP pyrophosphatase
MVELIQGERIAPLVADLISREKQVKEFSLDLTVRRIYELSGRSSLDFGGGEYGEPKRKVIDPVKQKPEDKYGWWSLNEGTYLVSLNEAVEALAGVGFISPHPRLLKAGCTHPTLFTLEWEKDYILPLTVGAQGLKLKENARISKLMVLKF